MTIDFEAKLAELNQQLINKEISTKEYVHSAARTFKEILDGENLGDLKDIWWDINDAWSECLFINGDDHFKSLMDAVKDLDPTFPVIADPLNFSIWFRPGVPVDNYSEEEVKPIPGECPILHAVANVWNLDNADLIDGSYCLEEGAVWELYKDHEYKKILDAFLHILLIEDNINSGEITLSHEYGCEENSITVSSNYGSELWIDLGYDNQTCDSRFITPMPYIVLTILKAKVKEWMEDNKELCAQHDYLDLVSYMTSVVGTWTKRYTNIHIKPSKEGTQAFIAFSCDDTPSFELERMGVPIEPTFTHKEEGVLLV